jgi:hypothetical protein
MEQGKLPAAAPSRLGRFTVRWKQAHENRAYIGLLTEIHLDCSERIYGQPLSAEAILAAWRGKSTPVSAPAERELLGGGEEEAAAPPQEMDPFAVVNLYDVYRSFQDLTFRLTQHREDTATLRALLVARPDSVYVLARMASNHSNSAVVRYLILVEARELFAAFGAGLDQRKKVHEWTSAARAEVRKVLAKDPAVTARRADPDELLAWFEKKLKQAGPQP